MKQYHKIQTVWLRDPETNHKKLQDGQWATPEFSLLKDAKWVWTEKVDGTNIRVIWDGESVELRGKSDAAQIPPHLLKYLEATFNPDTMQGLLPVCLYGEGFGHKIQSGGKYTALEAVRFCLFDAQASDGTWLRRETVEKIGAEMVLLTAPIIGRGTLNEAINLVRQGFTSQVAVNEMPAEGLVCRPSVELRTRMGERVITKIKHRDF